MRRFQVHGEFDARDIEDALRYLAWHFAQTVARLDDVDSGRIQRIEVNVAPPDEAEGNPL